jgi:hypothetical protein
VLRLGVTTRSLCVSEPITHQISVFVGYVFPAGLLCADLRS